MNNILKHYGILGMKWGRRKGSSDANDSSDHKKLSEIRKKKLKDMSDDELSFLVKRSSLVKTYRSTNFVTQKQINKMSNSELESGILKNQATVSVLKSRNLNNLKKLKDIKIMSDDELRKLMTRVDLEKSYSDIKLGDLKQAKQLVDEIIFYEPRKR